MGSENKARLYFWTKQHWHFLSFLFAVTAVCGLIDSSHNNWFRGAFLGVSAENWMYFGMAVPILHQTFVWICWRSELLYGSMRRYFGTRAFSIYRIGFALLFGLRPLSVLALGIANTNSLPMSTSLSYILGILLLVPAGYLFYSVRMYFGMDRAFGIDHFKPEIFRDTEFVRKGIFRITPNAMYVFGFLLLYSIAFFTLSTAAIVLALFNHLLIWSHYFFTEKPDMDFIYGNRSVQ